MATDDAVVAIYLFHKIINIAHMHMCARTHTQTHRHTHTDTHRQRDIHTYVFIIIIIINSYIGIKWLEQEIAQWVHPMKDRSDEPSHHERMQSKRPSGSLMVKSVSPNVIRWVVYVSHTCYSRNLLSKCNLW